MIEHPSSTSRPETSLPLVSESAAKRTRRLAIGPLVVVAVAIALLVIGKATTPQFVTGSNALTILRAASLTAIVALGLTFVTISGNYFSLSVAQTAVVASVLYASIGSSGGFVVGLIVALAVCTLLGAAQGAIVGLGANPVVVTFATGATVIGGVLVATHGNRVELHASGLATELGQSSPLGVPTETWAFVLCAVACYLVLERTTLGRRTKLVGANRDTAVASGLNVMRIVIAVFAISALVAAIAGVLTAAQFGVADSTQFTGTDINAIAAVLVGGTSIRGGEGSVQRTCMGAVFIAMLSNLLQVRGYSTGIQLTFIGLAVVIAVCAYGLVKRRTT
jgi:ribose transport system permease protein